MKAKKLLNFVKHEYEMYKECCKLNHKGFVSNYLCYEAMSMPWQTLSEVLSSRDK